jgi:propanediol dehydratase small subunit
MQMQGILAMRVFVGVLLAAAVMCCGPALADKAAADRCAAALPAASKTLYDGALPAVVGGTAVPDALRAVARPLVMNGSMSRDVARSAAEAAGACLRQVN